MKKGRDKGEKNKRPQKNPQKQERILEGGGGIFLAGQNICPWSKLMMSLKY